MKITIKTDTAAFGDGNARAEVIRILETIILKIETGFSSGKCMDINSNIVGSWG